MNQKISPALKPEKGRSNLDQPWCISLGSALARLEASLNLVDHINPALAADQTVVAMTTAQRFQRVTDLHGTFLML
jgi:hypothetical protein